MVKLNGKVTASTLIEVIVAMIIIVLVSGMASTFIIQNYKQTNASYKIKAFLLLDSEIELFKHENDFTDDVKEIEGYKIERIVSTNKLDEKLKNVDFIITDNKGHMILRRSKIFIINKVNN